MLGQSGRLARMAARLRQSCYLDLENADS
jgi:hypothetical protein